MITKDLFNELIEENVTLAKQIRTENGISIHSSSENAYAFIITGLRMLFPKITDDQLKECITDERGDASLDAVFFLGREKIVFLLDFKSCNFKYVDVKRFSGDIEQYLFDSQRALTGLSLRIQKKIQKARKCIGQDYKVRAFVVRKSVLKPGSTTRNLFQGLKSKYRNFDATFCNLDYLWERSSSAQSRGSIYPWKARICSGVDGDKIVVKERNSIKALLARIKLSEIVKLQGEFVRSSRNLFDANVRDFQKNKSLSGKIIDSIKNNPEEFYTFHNGLTFTCTEIRPLVSLKVDIYGPQVINGCQTVNSIYEEYKDKINDPNLKKASILCRFYALKEGEIEKVCEATNTQVKINLWDLRANDEIQRKIEKALSMKNIDYRRKKTSRKKGRIFITDLAQWIYSCKFGRPAEAKNNKSGLFRITLPNPPYEKIFDEKIKLENIVKICEIACFVKKKIADIKKEAHTFERDADLHFIAAIFRLEGKTWTPDWKFKKVHKIIRETIKEIRSKYGKDLNYNKIFTKREETWKLMEEKLDLL